MTAMANYMIWRVVQRHHRQIKPLGNILFIPMLAGMSTNLIAILTSTC